MLTTRIAELLGGRIEADKVHKATKAYSDKLEAQLYDPKYDSLIEEKARIASNGLPTSNAWFMSKSKPEQSRYLRNKQREYKDYKQYEDDRINADIEEMTKPKSNSVLDTIGNVLGSVDPTGLSSIAYNGLRGSGGKHDHSDIIHDINTHCKGGAKEELRSEKIRGVQLKPILEKYTVQKLKSFISTYNKTLKISGYSKMNKKDIIDRLIRAVFLSTNDVYMWPKSDKADVLRPVNRDRYMIGILNEDGLMKPNPIMMRKKKK
jgi:hypothetical protein